jgi:lipid-A-disaccharide synthase
VRDWVGEAAVMGIWEVLKKYRWFRREFHRMLGELCRERPDVLLLVDYPGFNLRFAAAVRRRSPSTRIIQYVSPQVWAWNRGRIPRMARLLDELICLFPFEKPLLEEGGVRVSFVGHPLVDELAESRCEEVAREEGLVGLFPGSREREVSRLMPMMIGVAARLREGGAVRFEVPAATAALGERIRGMLRESGAESFIRVTDGGSHSLMRRAAYAVIASGTATLEAACLGVPHCIAYRVAPLTYLVARMLVKIRHIGIVNILAGREVVPEFVQSRAEASLVAAQVRRMLDSADERERMAGELAAVCAGLGGPGVHARAAAVVARWLPGGGAA